MTSLLLLFLLLVSLFTNICWANEEQTSSHKKDYHGDKVLRLVPQNLAQQNWLFELYLKSDSGIYDFWTRPTRFLSPVDVHVAKDALEKFLHHLDERKINYTVTVLDLQKLIDDATALNHHRRPRDTPRTVEATNHIVGTFPTYEDINWYLNTICSKYSPIATCGSVGKTFENRKIPYIKIGAPLPNNLPKQEIFVEAGIHAREWLAPATAIYLIHMLTGTYKMDITTKRLLDRYDFVFVPLANPDGYEYSRLERNWRKTRAKTNVSICYGVDLNRNFDIYWGVAGSSNEPCSFIYRGPSAFSEPETKAMSNFLLERKSRTLAFFSLHTFAQMWLIPYATGNYPADYNELLRVAEIGVQALMAVNNQKWEVGNIADLLWKRSGGSEDWAKSIGIKYSYLLELRPLYHRYANGFVVDEDEIEPSGREVWAGLVAAIDAMLPLVEFQAVIQAVDPFNQTVAEAHAAEVTGKWKVAVIISAVLTCIFVVAFILIAKFVLCKHRDEVAENRLKNRSQIVPNNSNSEGVVSGVMPLMTGTSPMREDAIEPTEW